MPFTLLRPFTPFLALLPLATAQTPEWRPLHPLSATVRSGAMDPQRDRPLVTTAGLQHGLDLWEWHNLDWQRREPGAVPPLFEPVLVTDTVRSRLLAFGLPVTGTSGVMAFDGIGWQPVGSGINPIVHGATPCYDPVRDEVIFCGGTVPQAIAMPMWTWRNGVWTTRAPAGNWPSLRHDPMLAFDPVRGRTVLFGGFDWATLTPLGDTWEWDGATWTSFAGPAPSPRAAARMAYDPWTASVVMFGGFDGSFFALDQTWRFDGAQWLPVSQPAPPTARTDHVMITTPLGVLMVGGQMHGDTWLFAGGTWVPLRAYQNPAWRIEAAMDFDPVHGELLLHGGISDHFSGFLRDDTWTWDGSWRQRQPATPPPWRLGADLVFDRGRGEAVLFGGQGMGGLLADTWIWNGLDWSPRQPAGAPPPRSHHRLAFDRLRQRVVLFGGFDGTHHLGDTWLWDGANWLQAAPPQSPPARSRHLLAFDVTAGLSVLTAGLDAAGPRGDTWLWNGSAWAPTAATTAPTAAGDCEFDARRGRVVALASDRQWAWTGSDWVGTPIAAGGFPWSNPHGAMGAVIAYDEARQRLLLFGGDANAAHDWLLACTPTPAQAVGYGAGCAGAGAVPALFPLGLPALRNQGFRLGLRAAGSGLPTLVALGLAQQALPLGGGCSLLVDQVTFTSFQVSGPGGFTETPVPIPDLPQLRGLVVHCQGFAIGNGVLAVTAGLRLVVGD